MAPTLLGLGDEEPFYDAESDRRDYDVPQLTRLEAVKIRIPGGSQWVKNPLYVFRMLQNAPMSKAKVQHVKEEKPYSPEIHVRL